MLYQFIRLIAVLSLERFFDQIVVENIEKVPEGRPTIYVANHPNTVMDALVVGFAMKKKIHFVAKGTIFNNPLSSWFLMKLGIVPIYRRQDDPNKITQNEEVFRSLYKLLESGGSFLIFPEGKSIGDRMLHKMKTGAARIAFGVEERNDFSLNVQIVPVGLNYSKYQKFRSDVYCRFGKPIKVSDYSGEYQKDPVLAVQNLTETVRVGLQKVTTYLMENDTADLVSSLEAIYKKEMMIDMGMELKSKGDEFIATKGIINAVQWFQEREPKRVLKMTNKIRRYLNNLDRLHLRDEFLAPKKRGIGFGRRVEAWFYLVLGFPIFVWGTLNNFLPYRIPRWFTNKFTHQETAVSSQKLIVGVASFLILYTIQITLSWYILHNIWITSIYALTLIPSGHFALIYRKKANKYRQHLVFISLFYRRRTLVYNLIQQRIKLVKSLNKAKKEFLTAMGLDEKGKAASS